MRPEIDIHGSSTMTPELRENIKHLIKELLNSDQTERPQVIEEIVQLMKDNCQFSKSDPLFIEIKGQIIDSLLGYLLSIKTSYESDYYQFLALLNHMPIPTQSPFYQMLLGRLKEEIEVDLGLIEILDRLQVLHVMTETGDVFTAGQMVTELGEQVNKGMVKLWTIYQFCRFSVLRMQDKQEELLSSQLDTIIETYLRDGPDSAITFIVRWIREIPWGRQSILKKTLLMQLNTGLGEQRTLNSAMVLYELFCMDDRMVPSTEKLACQKKLIKFPASILNIKQLQHLYFFAGNYTCGVQSKFKESIRNYQYSNYFLHKRWEQLLSMSQFLREHLPAEVYFRSLPYLEKNINELSNQVSLQNNAYVESLQAGYDKIEELYDKVGELSLTDSLTGLRNRRYLDNNLPLLIAFASRHSVPVSLAMIDIDFFKRVNDTFGHQAGDYVLRGLSKLIADQFRQSDIILRYGGEEFLIVLFGLDVDKCFTKMEELRLLVQGYSFIYRKNVIPITISIGVACDEQSETKPPDLHKIITNSDKALFQAKRTGRNKVVIFKSRKRSMDSSHPENPA